MNQIIELQPGQARQFIDAETIFLELLRVREEQKETRGSMFWREVSGTSYLIRESSGGAQKSLGPKDAQTELIFQKFQTKKASLSERLKSLNQVVQTQQRLNKALRVGRTPDIVVKTLNALRDTGLHTHFLTIGTHALYAYESACGVRFMPDALATQDIDLLFDSRKRLSFVSKLKKMDSSFIGALQKADPTFRVMSDQKQTAINAAGFEVDIIRRMTADADPHPLKMSDFDDDLWAVQIGDGNRMLGSRRFDQVIASETGHMAVMSTIDPRMFVALKIRLSQSPGRDSKKRPKDALQAKLVQALIDGFMPQYQ
ncbi:MAG TPA: GSU2403 family nucleotidyltransferase fold protein [Rhodoferax sp.]